MLTFSSLRQMTLKANMASVIADTDDMEAQNTLLMHESKSAVIVRRKLDQSILTGEISFPQEKSLEPGTVVSQNLDASTKEMCTEKDLLLAISNIYQENLSIPIRQEAQQVPICKTSVHKVVRKKIKLYPYKIQIVQSLEDPDYEKRESFARTDLDPINADVTLPWPPRSPDVTPLGFFFGVM